MIRYRVEKDSLGEKKVPSAAYYGVQTQRAVENFPVSGRPTHASIRRAFLQQKKASARAHLELAGEPLVATKLANDTLRRHVALLERTELRLREVLLLRVGHSEHDGGVAVFLLRSLADDLHRAHVDDRDALNGAVFFVELGHPELLADHARFRVHFVLLASNGTS